MSKFSEMIADAKAGNELKAAEEKKARDEDTARRALFVKNAIQILEENIVPLLTEAIADFEAEGIQADINRKYDVENSYNSENPRLVFRCIAPEPASGGRRFSCTPFYFAADEKFIYVTSGKKYLRDTQTDLGKIPASESVDDIVGNVIKLAADDYFKRLRSHD